MDAGHAALLALAVLYLVPLACAIWRGHPKGMQIIALNVILGWTGIGWIAALIWAFTGPGWRARRGGGGVE